MCVCAGGFEMQRCESHCAPVNNATEQSSASLVNVAVLMLLDLSLRDLLCW